MRIKVEELIDNVYKNPPIWDKRLKDHSNRGIVDNCWKKICEDMKIEEHLLRKKWKYLRDQFGSEFYKNRNVTDSASVKWQYFDTLYFLKDVIKPRFQRSMPNHSPSSNDDSGEKPIEELECVVLNGDEETEDVEDNEFIPSEIVSVSTSLPTHRPVKRKHQSESDTFYNESLAIEQGNSSTSHYFPNHESVNYDLMFLQSLTPFISKIPMRKKLKFRAKVLSLIEEFSSPDSSAGPN